MEGSSTREDTSFLCYPCYFFKKALEALFKCPCLESGTKQKKNSSMVKAPSYSKDDLIAQENTERNSRKTFREALPTSAEEAADHEHASTIQTFELVTSVMAASSGPRRPGLSQGSGGQTY